VSATNVARLGGGRMFFVDDLQACEPEFLTSSDGTHVVREGRDAMGFARVRVEGPTRASVVEYVRANWGEEDPGWFKEWVVDRVREDDVWAKRLADRRMWNRECPHHGPGAIGFRLRCEVCDGDLIEVDYVPESQLTEARAAAADALAAWDQWLDYLSRDGVQLRGHAPFAEVMERLRKIIPTTTTESAR
jgi:hypothetical protein